MAKEITPKSSKNEIFEAYQEMMDKIQEQTNQSPKQAKETEEKQKIVKTASGINFESIIKDTLNLKMSLNQALESIEKSLTTEWKKLTTIQEAISIEEQRLQDMYQIVANADSLSALINAQKEKKQKFEIEFQEEKSTMEKDISETRFVWNAESEEHKKTLKEQIESLKQQRIREEEEYQYNLKQTRRKEQDSYMESKTSQEKLLAEQKASFEKEYAERETKIKEHEAEYADLLKKVSAFPVELDKNIKQTEKTITEQLTSKHNHEKELLGKETEGERKLKDQTINALQEKIKEQAALILQLTAKADNATIQVKDIAMKAVENSFVFKNMEKGKEG